MCWFSFSYCFIPLLSDNHITLQHVSLSCNWRNCISRSSQVSSFLKNVTMFPVVYYEYDCNTICHKNFIMIHSLVDRLSFCEAIIPITPGYHKAILLLLLRYQFVWAPTGSSCEQVRCIYGTDRYTALL